MPTAQGKPQPGDLIRDRQGNLVGTTIRRSQGNDGYSVYARMEDTGQPRWITEFEWWAEHNGWTVIAAPKLDKSAFDKAELLAKANQALDLIAAELSGREWSADTLDAIAAIIRATGRDIRDPFDTQGS